MSFLREILDEFVIGWDEKRYDKWKEKDDRRWNARTMKPLLTRTVSWSELDYSGDGEMKERAPDYPEEVLQWLEEFEDLHLAVEDYDDRYPSLRGKDPEKMVLEEILCDVSGKHQLSTKLNQRKTGHCQIGSAPDLLVYITLF